MDSDFYDELPDILEIKEFIKKLTPVEISFNKSLSDTDSLLNKSLQDFSFSMFANCKAKDEQFTINNNETLEEIQLDEQTGDFSFQDTLTITAILFNNIEAFHTLVANSYEPHEKIFYVSCKSKYRKENMEIFIANRDREFFAIFDNLSDIKLSNFICNYLGGVIKDIQPKLQELAMMEDATHKDLQTKLTDFFKSLSEDIEKLPEFIYGAISFFDFLGWKGLWRGNDTKPLQVVAELIENFTEELNKETAPIFPYVDNMSTLISISDTIAIFTPKIDPVTDIQLIELHSKIARNILEVSSKVGYPIRGAIACGKYSIMNNVMIGPGIDECASWHEKCDWIGVHVTPSAQFTLDINDAIPKNIKKFSEIPLKKGLPKLKYCVIWDITQETFERLLKKAEAILPEIASKYTNTYKFLYDSEGER